MIFLWLGIFLIISIVSIFISIKMDMPQLLPLLALFTIFSLGVIGFVRYEISYRELTSENEIFYENRRISIVRENKISRVYHDAQVFVIHPALPSDVRYAEIHSLENNLIQVYMTETQWFLYITLVLDILFGHVEG